MTPLPTSNGVPYLPDGQTLNLPPQPRPLWMSGLIFLLVYGALSVLYGKAGGSGIERFFLESLGSQPAAALISAATPDIAAHAAGSRIVAAGGGLNIRNGCEGTDLLFLLAAGFAAASLTWRKRLSGFALGLVLAVVLNQIRILCLFYSFRADKALFDLLHTTVAPIVLIVLIALYFYAWLDRYQTRLA